MEAVARETRVREYFERAIASRGADRASVIAQARAEDESLASEVESLLAYSDETGLLDGGVSGVADVIAELTQECGKTPSDIGQFAVVREIGRGGMGVVYEAQQKFPQRRVAVKLVRSDVATPSMMRRFRHEAQALGMLQHTAIAQVLEAGVAQVDGRARSFIAMELADGLALHKWVRERKASPREILELMAKVADGVDHAHKRGVIHRDMKPSNVIVNERAEPKILDFGVARLTESGQQTGATIATAAGQVIGTIGYMSPQQLSGDQRQIDVRCDVYAMGAMLYELLADKPAIEVPTLSLLEAIEAIKTKDPTPLGRVRTELRGDIEAIVGKALEKSVEKRYQTASELTEDIRRYLQGQPVLARPQTAMYQFRKFAGRNKALVTAASVVAATVVAAVAGVAWQAVLATRAAERATQQAQRAEQTAEVLRRMIAAGTPQVSKGREFTVREMLDASAESLDKATDLDPLVRASTHTLLGDAYRTLTKLRETLLHKQAALDIYVTELGDAAPESLKAKYAVAMAYSNLSQGNIAEPMMRSGLAESTRILGPDHDTTIDFEVGLGHAVASNSVARIDEAAKLSERAWEHCIRLYGREHPRTVEALHTMVVTVSKLKFDRRLLEIQRELVRLRETVSGTEDPRTLQAKGNLARSLMRLNERDEAWSLLKEIEEPCQRVLGESHMTTEFTYMSLAEFAIRHQDFPEALRLATISYRYARSQFDISSLEYISATNFYNDILMLNGRYEEAIQNAEEIYVKLQNRVDVSAHVKDMTMGQYAFALVKGGRIEDAKVIQQCMASSHLREQLDVMIQQWYKGDDASAGY